MRNIGLDEAQAGIKIAGRNINNLAGRNINNLRYAYDTTLMAESEEELQSLLMKMKEESGKVGLKLNVQKTKIMTSSPITSWQIDWETVEDFIFSCELCVLVWRSAPRTPSGSPSPFLCSCIPPYLPGAAPAKLALWP